MSYKANPEHHHLPLGTRPGLRPYKPRRTGPLVWLAGALCALVTAAITLGGLAVLIVYLVFRPRGPRIEVSSVTLNAAYIDSDTSAGAASGGFDSGIPLLNADATVLANFSNPNDKKVGISFGYLELDLYFKGALVATQGIAAFAVPNGESALRSVEMVASQVALSPEAAEAWRTQEAAGLVEMEVRSLFRTRMELGGFLHFSYWLHGRCAIAVASPPGGVLLARACSMRRRL